jgi:hyperosmotically inducible periplasmic protein
MNAKPAVAGVACGMLAAVLVPAAAVVVAQVPDDSERSHPTQWVRDSAITATIKTRLAAQHFSSLTHVNVATDMNGVVLLSGTARTQQEVDKAVEVARSTEGVARVKNDIAVRSY